MIRPVNQVRQVKVLDIVACDYIRVHSLYKFGPFLQRQGEKYWTDKGKILNWQGKNAEKLNWTRVNTELTRVKYWTEQITELNKENTEAKLSGSFWNFMCQMVQKRSLVRILKL